MSAPFKVMLASNADLDKLRFPLLASPKLDGVRAYVKNGVVWSRSNKRIPNQHVQNLFHYMDGFDGELIVGPANSPTCYRDTVSGVMREDGEPEVRFHAFDLWNSSERFTKRYDRLQEIVATRIDNEVITVKQFLIAYLPDLLMLELSMLDKGYEGLILRDQYSPYKQGRSTVKEGYLLKLKRFVDSEAMVVGFEERMHNGNEAKVNELGRTSRSSHKANKTGRGDLGALVLQTPQGVEFSCGTGFSDADRADIWKNRDRYRSQFAKYKHFPVGVKDAPRHPVFLGWRDKIDM